MGTEPTRNFWSRCCVRRLSNFREHWTIAKHKYTSEAIIHKLREADGLLGQGKTILEVAKQLGITDQTYFRWRNAYGGLKVALAKRLRELESENARLKPAVAELTVDKRILKEVAEGKY